MLKLYIHKASNIIFSLFQPPKVRINAFWLLHQGKQAHQHTSTQDASKKYERKRGEEKANLFDVLEVGERKTRG